MGNKGSGKKSDYISVPEIAKLTGKSVQGIYRRLKQPLFDGKVKTIDGVLMVHRSAVEQAYGLKEEPDSENINKADQEEPDKPSEPNRTDLLIALLQEQLKAKDKQIADLTEALKAEQILRASADQRIALLEDKQMTRAEEPSTPSESQGQQVSDPEPATPESKTDQEQPQPMSFLQRIRKKLRL